MKARKRTDSACLWVVVGAFALAACASAPSRRVNGKVLEKLTIENRLLLFDAENELNIAVDARYQVVDEIDAIKDDIERARDKLDTAKRDQKTFSSRKNSEQSRIAAFRVAAQKSRIKYLEARLEWARERLDVEDRRLIVAQAKFELAKARLVKKNNVPGASKIKIEDFEKQVAKYESQVDDADQDVERALTQLTREEEAWIAATQQLQEATGGALGSRWLDD